MSETIFNRVEVGQEPLGFFHSDELCSRDFDNPMLIPDITGDGTPDFIEFAESFYATGKGDGDKAKFINFSYEISLRPGVYDAANKLVPSTKSEVIDYFDSYNNPTIFYMSCQRIILKPEFNDFNNDRLTDISFWFFTGKDDRSYQQVLLLNETEY